MKAKFDLDLISDARLVVQRYTNYFRLFLVLCLNVFVAQAVYAAADGNGVTKGNAYAIGLLGLVVVALAIYLLVVMFQPQRF